MASRRQGPLTASGKCKNGKAKAGPRKGLCRLSKRAKKA